MTLISDFQYFSPSILYKSLYKASNIIFEQCDFFQKMSFRNRCQIVGAEGLIDLSIPLEKGRDQKTIMKDVRISGLLPWQMRHWKTIVSCYSRSPWFEYYRDDLEILFRKRYHFLVDWNWSCFEWTVGTLKIPIPVSVTQVYRKEYEEGWVDWRGALSPKGRESGWVGLTGAFGSPPLKYRQVFQERIGFVPHLSILDLLFCEGAGAAVLLES
jgi:WbqC-like protein family